MKWKEEGGGEEYRQSEVMLIHSVTMECSSGLMDHPLCRLIPTSGISSSISSPEKVILRVAPASTPSPE